MYKVLIVGDVEADVDLQLLKLIRAGFACEARRVETPEDFARQLEFFVPDVILCGASLPRLSGFTALAMAQRLCPDTPFIIVFGTSSEEAAVETLNGGAADHVFKTSLAELPSAFGHAVKEAEERRKRKTQESAIARLTRMYADQVRELEQLQRQHVTLRKLSRYLQASLTPAEVYAAVECFGPQLLHGTNGKLYLVRPPGKHLEPVAAWGDKSRDEQTFTTQD
ncbi:MAG: response regulator, partial [Burkholderiales bacterium]